jgi:hypothetical protein
MYHNGLKMTDEFPNLKFDRITHPPYSSDLSPCDFWLFGMLKQKIKDRMFQTVEKRYDRFAQGTERADLGRPAVRLL